jgi:iron complex transport system ATP-binding protein
MRLKICNVHFSYGSVSVLKDISMAINESEIVGILGPNGSGKTTLMKCIDRILEPQQGRLLYNDKDLSNMSRQDVSKILGYVPQNHSNETGYPTVFEVVLMGRRPYGYWRSNSTDNEKVWSALEEMDVADLADRKFNELSSGQTQRVLMARAIAQEAKIMLLDEPTSNLDVKYQMEVMDTVKKLSINKGIGACAIVHDLDLAMKYCDKGILLLDGQIVAAGDIESVITPESIRHVYNVEAIIDRNYNRPHVFIP